MFHLLPEKEKRILKRDYYFRLTVVALLFLILSAIIASVFLFPSYILSERKLADMKTQNERVKAEIARKSDPTMSDFLSSLNTKISALSIKTGTGSSTEYLKEITDKKIDGVSINEFSLTDGEQKTILVGGNADNRDALTKFYRDLQTISDFDSVDLPISDFAKGTNIDFNITITIKK